MRVHNKETAHQTLLAQLFHKSKLLDRITDAPAPLPLVERLSTPPLPHIPPPIPDTLHFHKTKILSRIKEHMPLLEATKIRLEPLFTKLNKEDDNEHYGFAVRVPRDVQDTLWSWYSCLEELYADLEVIGYKLTNAEWRKLKGALKHISKVDFTQLNTRLPDICNELVALSITLP